MRFPACWVVEEMNILWGWGAKHKGQLRGQGGEPSTELALIRFC